MYNLYICYDTYLTYECMPHSHIGCSIRERAFLFNGTNTLNNTHTSLQLASLSLRVWDFFNSLPMDYTNRVNKKRFVYQKDGGNPLQNNISKLKYHNNFIKMSIYLLYFSSLGWWLKVIIQHMMLPFMLSIGYTDLRSHILVRLSFAECSMDRAICHIF